MEYSSNQLSVANYVTNYVSVYTRGMYNMHVNFHLESLCWSHWAVEDLLHCGATWAGTTSHCFLG